MIKAQKNGFTMIELLVAMSLFVVVIGIASAIFINSLRAQRVIVDLIAINDNASLALEQMAREIRVGTGFSLASESQIDFTNGFGQQVSYRFNSLNESLERKLESGNYEAITGTSVKIKQLKFITAGLDPNDDRQPRITISLSVGSASARLAGFLTNLQTTLSPRELDS